MAPYATKPQITYVYRLQVRYPEGSDTPGWQPEGWEPEWNGDPDADLSFHWPRVRDYFGPRAAKARADLLRGYGCEVEVLRSQPVTW